MSHPANDRIIDDIIDNKSCERHTKDDGSWWENDGRGIPLCRVCEHCRDEKLSKYRPEILEYYDESDVCEQIEDDY
jgi:hypothetical protein